MLSLLSLAAYMSLHCSPDGGEPVKFLSDNTLHIIDRLMWMLPFVTRTDLETAAKAKGVSQETRNTFLNKMLAEHSLPGVRDQLKTLWATWVEKNYAQEPVAAAASRTSALSMDAPTPPDEDEAPAPVMTEDQMMENVEGAAKASGGDADAA
jgi:hypothetical protein